MTQYLLLSLCEGGDERMQSTGEHGRYVPGNRQGTQEILTRGDVTLASALGTWRKQIACYERGGKGF